MYTIMIDYYSCLNDENGNTFDYKTPCYLGTEGKLKLFIWEHNITSNTKLFQTAKECGEYLDKHFKEDFEIYGENLRIVKIYKENF